ncbi:MAG: hypothetical protein J2P30_01530 [Actinobacteria bacterium]|nr:hypothetical protein [Actinomycetota bacterium]
MAAPAYKMTAWKVEPGGAAPATRRYDDPLEALVGAMAHLLRGYQVRLSDTCVAWFRDNPLPEAAAALRQAAGKEDRLWAGCPDG